MLNNEFEINREFRRRIKELKLMVNFYYSKEDYIYPKESVLWGTFEKGEGQILSMEQTDWYKNDHLGLRHLNEGKRLIFEELKGKHQNNRTYQSTDMRKIVFYLE